tara:strand:- start:27705 stop:29300 length:1596 start_codon:yes stop_codon:yes gene_type:complete
MAPNTSDENKIIYLNFVFLQNNEGKGNFEEGNPEHDEIIDGIITNLNYRMSHLINDQVDGCTNDIGNESTYFINDTKIQFNVKKLYIKNSLWDYTNSGIPSGNISESEFVSSYSDANGEKKSIYPPSRTLVSQNPNVYKENFYLRPLSESLSENDTLHKAINVFFPTDGVVYNDMVRDGNYDNYIYLENAPFGYSVGIGAGEYPKSNDFNATSNIVLPNVFLNYKWNIEVKFNTDEYGHIFTGVVKLFVNNLNYTYSQRKQVARNEIKLIGKRILIHELGHNFYLYHSFSSNSPCTNNIMSYNSTGWKYGNTYFRGWEVDKMHYKLSTTNLINFVDEEVFIERPLVVNSTDIVPTSLKTRIYNNLIVDETAHLTLNREQFVTSNKTTIYLHNNAKLTINNNYDDLKDIKSVGEGEEYLQIKILESSTVVLKPGTYLSDPISITRGEISELNNLLSLTSTNVLENSPSESQTQTNPTTTEIAASTLVTPNPFINNLSITLGDASWLGAIFQLQNNQGTAVINRCIVSNDYIF